MIKSSESIKSNVMRKDKDLAQIGILVKPELREWLTDKCQNSRTLEGRIVDLLRNSS